MSTFKLISRNDKINIYDPYADKYYVVEDDDELNKILDENGKLIPDEQIRQYFNSKESKSRKVQRGFVSKKANLKKEYADVEKQVFNDLIKYKLYQKYGANLSNDDISAFNKNPSINTIKNFKSVRSEIKNDMQTLFKNNEAQFSQDYEDKNNLASILNELRNINQTAFDNVFNQRKIGYMTLKEDAKAAVNDYDNAEKLKVAINHMKNTVAQMTDVDPKIPAIVNKPKPTKEEIQQVIKIAEDKEKKLDKQAEHYDEFAYRVPNQYIKWNGDDSGVTNGKNQLSKASTIYGYNMAPIQSLYKNLAYLTSSPENFNTLGTMTVDEQDKSYNIAINFGDNDEYQFDYTISKTSPYANEMMSAIKNMPDVTDDYNKFNNLYQQMSDSVIKYKATESEDKTADNVDNEVKYDNKLKTSADYKTYMENNPKKLKIIEQIQDDKISFNDFDTFNKAITAANWYDEKTFEPEIEFNQDREFHATNDQWYRTSNNLKTDKIHPIQHPLQHALATSEKEPDRHYYKHNMSEFINDQAEEITNKIVESNEDAKKMNKEILKQLIIGNAYENVVTNKSKPATEINVPFVVIEEAENFDPENPEYLHKLDYDFNSFPDKNKVFKKISKTLYDIPNKNKLENTTVKKETQQTINTIKTKPELNNVMLQGINELHKDINDNLSKAHFWYWTDKYVGDKDKFEVYDPKRKPSRVRPMQEKDYQGIHTKNEAYTNSARESYAPINVISPALNRAYKMYNVKPDSFYKGFGRLNPNGQTINGFKSQAIRDLLSSRINNHK